jgi:hypothetical protein
MFKLIFLTTTAVARLVTPDRRTPSIRLRKARCDPVPLP